MKTKIKKSQGYYKLVVADEKINQNYGYSNEDPIVLANMINFFDSGCWSVSDYRLNKNLQPSPYLDEGSQNYVYKTEEEKSLVLSKINSYNIDEERQVIWWHLFDSYAYDGDNPHHTDSFGYVQNEVARFTYKGALQRLREAKEFWTKFEGEDLQSNSVRIDNPYRQIHSTALHFLVSDLQSKNNEAQQPLKKEVTKSMKMK